MGNTYIIRYEELGIGAQWNNIAVSPLEGDPFSLLGCILMQLADTVIYMLIALYIETVFPGLKDFKASYFGLKIKKIIVFRNVRCTQALVFPVPAIFLVFQ